MRSRRADANRLLTSHHRLWKYWGNVGCISLAAIVLCVSRQPRYLSICPSERATQPTETTPCASREVLLEKNPRRLSTKRGSEVEGVLANKQREGVVHVRAPLDEGILLASTLRAVYHGARQEIVWLAWRADEERDERSQSRALRWTSESLSRRVRLP